jgi:hypothetical protein
MYTHLRSHTLDGAVPPQQDDHGADDYPYNIPPVPPRAGGARLGLHLAPGELGWRRCATFSAYQRTFYFVLMLAISQGQDASHVQTVTCEDKIIDANDRFRSVAFLSQLQMAERRSTEKT